MIFCWCIWGQVGMDSYANRFGAAVTVDYTLTLIQTNKGGIQVTATMKVQATMWHFFLSWDEMVKISKSL